MSENQTPGQGQDIPQPQLGNPEHVIASHTIFFNGMPILLKPLNYRSRAEFSKWQKQRALACIMEDPAAYGGFLQEAIAQVARDHSAGVFGWGEPLFMKTLNANDPFGRIQMVWLSIRQSMPEFTEKEGWKFYQKHGDEAWKVMLEFINRPNSDGPLAPETPKAAA